MVNEERKKDRNRDTDSIGRSGLLDGKTAGPPEVQRDYFIHFNKEVFPIHFGGVCQKRSDLQAINIQKEKCTVYNFCTHPKHSYLDHRQNLSSL